MDIFDKAIIFSVNAHSGMVRKTKTTPYILHPMEVATIVGTMTSDREVLAAAILHDTVEDTSATAEEIKEKFGERIATLVASETENKRIEMTPEDSWEIRKKESLEVLRRSDDINVKILWMGDKLANVRSFYRAWREKGNDLWLDFHQKDASKQAWYYRTIAELTIELDNTDAWKEYNNLINLIFKGVK
ncbi:MAG: HD domain-containing protein [Clostridia bacterium]|nr:HD domain-containing protein [Clostridia bacterium]